MEALDSCEVAGERCCGFCGVIRLLDEGAALSLGRLEGRLDDCGDAGER